MNASILVVEESVVTSLAICRLIEDICPGCRIRRAQSCFEARLLLRVYEFQLSVVDVHLPDGNGLELVPDLLDSNPAANIVVLTGGPLLENSDPSLALGVHRFLTKPLSAITLQEAVRTSLPSVQDHPEDGRFTASLRGLSVLDVIQIRELRFSRTPIW